MYPLSHIRNSLNSEKYNIRYLDHCACYDECGNFAGFGAFNGEPAFEIVEATDELYELVHGVKPERDEDAEDDPERAAVEVS